MKLIEGIGVVFLFSTLGLLEPVRAHEGATDATGCHGKKLTGLEHCHVDSVSLYEQSTTDIDIGDARRGARDVQLPDCMTCEEVAAVQRALATLGHRPGPIDGVLGPLTRAAVKSYQRSVGLEADGYLSELLVSRLLGEA